ncbi:hypothetical protein KVR01_003973 [Diaporthe batatas]|uniref:uncharacterized protein n=1 Tax=Diaporthe batatas TaxID=748121 RepID=UPI001D048778|nr:uncharacterized protein KVR01_003973 [Diaporthe batatas]KAG8168284.1 hypothetical protein KVR01_003973 [Diaporthe batatas]
MECIPRAWCFNGEKHSAGPNQCVTRLNPDSSPIEISVNFTSVIPNPVDRPPVRVIAEVDHLTGQKTLEEYCRRNTFGNIDYQMDWPNWLYGSVMKGSGSTYFGDVRLGFDIRRAVRPEMGSKPQYPGPIPADARVYFALVKKSILTLPGLYDNTLQMRRILSGVNMIDKFLAGYPPEFGNLLSTVDIGPEEPARACIGLSFTVPAGATSADFREPWKWLNLGRRITEVRKDRKNMLSFIRFFKRIYGGSGLNAPDLAGGNNDGGLAGNAVDLGSYIERFERLKAGTFIPQVAPCSVHFTIATDSPEPRATLRLDVLYNSNTDLEVARRYRGFLLTHTRHDLQDWHGWPAPYLDIVKNLFPGMPHNARVHNSLSLCRQEGPNNREWSVRASYNPHYFQ